MISAMPPPFPRWAVCVVSVLAAAGLGWLLVPWVGDQAPYLLFTVSVLLSARYGGLWSGVVATLLGGGVAFSLFVDAPRSAGDWLLLAVYVAVGLCLAFLAESQRATTVGASEAALRHAENERLLAEGALARDRDHLRLQAEMVVANERAEELEQSLVGLREASRLKDDFLATVAHELRTPLSAMLGWAHILRDEEVDRETSVRALDAIVRNGGFQTRLIADLLDISRIVAGTMRVELQTVELVAVIRSALETVRPTAEAKGVLLTSTVDAEAGPVIGDPSRLQQVLGNLLSNSIKFTPRGGTVAVRVQAVAGQVDVTVEDSGPGIPPEFLPHVFERFRQAAGAPTRGKGGLGLGLAIVRHLVELHGGTVSVANRETASGAVFVVRLPIKAFRPDEARPVPLAEPSADLDAAAAPSLADLHVLVLEDGDEAREMMSMVLEKRGARVTAVPYAKEALASLTELRPDVFLADLELGDAGADSVIRALRALPEAGGGAIPAAALGTYTRAEDRTRALLAGFQMHLAKPVRPAELVAAVASLCGRTRRPSSVPETRDEGLRVMTVDAGGARS